MSHFVEKCKHGVILGQCRCPGPKTVRIGPCPAGHEDMLDVTTLPTSPPTDIAQPPVRPQHPDDGDGEEGWYGSMLAKSQERKAIVVYLRKKSDEVAKMAGSPSSALYVGAAFLVDVAQQIENGEHGA